MERRGWQPAADGCRAQEPQAGGSLCPPLPFTATLYRYPLPLTLTLTLALSTDPKQAVDQLREALKAGQLVLSREAWRSLGIADLRVDHFVQVRLRVRMVVRASEGDR